MKNFFERLSDPETFVDWVLSIVLGFTFTLCFWWGYAQLTNQFTTPDERAATRAMWDDIGASNGM